MSEHGTVASYRIRGCRCEECREANREDVRDRTEQWESSPIHGTVDQYRRGCTCVRCGEAQRAWAAEQLAAMPADRHGDGYLYKTLGCRCEPCRVGHQVEYRAKISKGIPDGDRRHGTESGYAAGCRCQECKDAVAAAAQKRAAKRNRRAAS